MTDNELRKIIYTISGNSFDQRVLVEDAKLISEFYNTKGYYNIKVPYPQIITKSPSRIDVIFIIEEKEKLNINEILFSGNNYFPDQKIYDSIFKRKTSLNEFPEVMQNILEFYTSNGFLFAEVSLDSLVRKKISVDAYLKISEGKFCEFDEFKFRGNKTTKENTLLRISYLNNVKLVTPHTLERSAENIREKTYIKNCETIPLNHHQLLFEIEEDRMSLISGIIGYDNSKSSADKLTGYLNVDFLNLYGTDRSLSLFWQRISSDKNSIELSYHESGFYRYPICGDFLIFREEVDSTYIKATFDSNIYYFDMLNNYGLYYGMKDIFPGSRRPKIVEKYSFKKAGIFWKRNSLDYNMNPASGSASQIKYYNIFNKVENKNVSKQAVETSWSNYRKLTRTLVFAINLNANIIENKDLTEFDSFDLGGNKNLRGFNEDQFSGFVVGWSNLELRYLLSRNSRAFIFCDYGYVENLNYSFGKLFGFGFGMRVETRLGILGIDYGFNYFDNKLRNPLDGIIHFGLETKL